jgi:ATP-dependent DNA helicase DinG
MTSASLAVDKNFDFQKKNIGLSDNERFRGLIVDSPFDFRTQSLLLVPADMPEPGREEYEDSLSQILSDSISVTNGNALVLFTSYSSLNRVYEKTGRILERSGFGHFPLFKQGEMPRGLLLEKFKTLGNSVLFATDSFWEGVDIPGDSLRMVVICRLPFKVPTDPVTEAKIEYMEKQDVDSFREYILPHAVLRFKQGFGRLIRTKTDRGVVMVLDRRIVSKYYGKFFINSVAGSDFFCGKTEQVLGRMRNFFFKGQNH